MAKFELVMANAGVYHVVDKTGQCVWTIKSKMTKDMGQSPSGHTFHWLDWTIDRDGKKLGRFNSLKNCLINMKLEWSNWPGPYHILKRSGIPDPKTGGHND